MSRRAPVVAELGRPETPGETAARKAASSKAYRSSMTFRNLIVALLVSLAVVAVIVFAVPRGTPVEPDPIDVAAIAQNVRSSVDGPVLEPELGKEWRVNAAELEGGATLVWNITIAPSSEEERGFVRIAQAFGADVSWAPQKLGGVAPTDTVEAGGLTWDAFRLSDASANANISYALGTQAGDDYVLLYGSLSSEDTAALAESLAPQVRELTEER